MGGQTEFLEAVRELERLAETNNNHLDMEEIRAYFSDMDLKDEQLDYICRYLESRRIFIENRVKRGQNEIADDEVTTKEDPLDADMVNIYMEEIGKASRVSEEQSSSTEMRTPETFSSRPIWLTPPLWQRNIRDAACC